MAHVLECDGLGFKKTVDAEALIEDPSKSIADGVFGSLFGNSNYYPQILLRSAKNFKGELRLRRGRTCLPRVRRCVFGWHGRHEDFGRLPKLDGRRSQWDTKFSGVRNILYEALCRDNQREHQRRLSSIIFARAVLELPWCSPAPRMLAPSPWAASPFTRSAASRVVSRSSFEGPGAHRAPTVYRRAHRQKS